MGGKSSKFQGRTVVEYCQQQIIQYYQDTTSTMPAHPLDPSRTVDIDKFFFDLELTQRGKQITRKHLTLPWEERILDRVEHVSLKTWEDFFRVEKVGGIKVLISGGAGFGKSTLLLKIANISSVRTSRSPLSKFKFVFWVKLRQMQKTSCVLDAIWDQIMPKDTQLGKADLKKLLGDHEAETAFLFDGLDEIPPDILRSPAPEDGYSIQDVLYNRVLKKSFVLVTMRPHMVDYALKGYPQYACVQTWGFTSTTAHKYITAYFAEKNASSTADKLISTLKSSRSFQSLAQIPIILHFMCIIWENLGKLPERLTELYTEFAEVLVSRQCGEDEDKKLLMTTLLRELGRVALSGLLDPKGERLMFSSEEFEEGTLKDGCRLGFLQQESFTSGLRAMRVATFLHKSFQEYCAGYFLANLHHADQAMFHEKLRQMNLKKIYAMEYLLRFACGVASGSEATGLILEHLQRELDQRNCIDKSRLHGLARLLLFESGSDKLADKLQQPAEVMCKSQEDLAALQHYLKCIPNPLEDTKFALHCSSYEALTCLREVLLSGKIRPATSQSATSQPSDSSVDVEYTLAERGNKEMSHLERTLKEMEAELCEKVRLTLSTDERSSFDDEHVMGQLPNVSNQLVEVCLYGGSHSDAFKLANALNRCKRLEHVGLSNINLHGQVCGLAPLAPPTLQSLILIACGLDDDDVPDLTSILPAGHGLLRLDVHHNMLTLKGMKTLTAHLQGLPKLNTLWHFYDGRDADRIKRVVEQNLPNIYYA
ncbi:uncharacterized protein LOC110977033 [Acanthaster planci]|uniref:Uncharacterized protein LOC110977033 n=1 Tax=Acanthaster planci TaxID=133434 RepID=A0A8B7Y2G0_ACAPL|nr:uncharacterized protein LOC110977033 [Acanthaster planci]